MREKCATPAPEKEKVAVFQGEGPRDIPEQELIGVNSLHAKKA